MTAPGNPVISTGTGDPTADPDSSADPDGDDDDEDEGEADADAIVEPDPVADSSGDGSDPDSDVLGKVDVTVASSAGQLQGLLQSFLVKPAALATLTTLEPLAAAFELDGMAREIRNMLASGGFNDSLNRMRDGINDATVLHHSVVGSGVAVTTTLSVGYVAWLVRGGVLLSTALSSLPAWQFIDPLPVLARTGDSEDGGSDDDSLQDIIKEQAVRDAKGREAADETPASAKNLPQGSDES